MNYVSRQLTWPVVAGRQWVLAGGSSFTVAFCRDTVGPSARRFQVLLPPPHCECPSLKPPGIIYISLTVATAGAWGWVSSSQGGGCRPFLSTAAARESRRAAKQVCVCVCVCVCRVVRSLANVSGACYGGLRPHWRQVSMIFGKGKARICS